MTLSLPELLSQTGKKQLEESMLSHGPGWGDLTSSRLLKLFCLEITWVPIYVMVKMMILIQLVWGGA